MCVCVKTLVTWANGFDVNLPSDFSSEKKLAFFSHLRQVHVADFPFATVSEPSPFADFFQLRQVHVTEFPLATVSVSRSFSGFSRDTCDSSDFMVIHRYILPIFPFATVPNFMLLTFHLQPFHVRQFRFHGYQPLHFADFSICDSSQLHVVDFPLATISDFMCDSSDFKVINRYILPIFPFATVPNFMLLTFHLQPFQISCATVPISWLSTVTFCRFFHLRQFPTSCC